MSKDINKPRIIFVDTDRLGKGWYALCGEGYLAPFDIRYKQALMWCSRKNKEEGYDLYTNLPEKEYS